MGLKNSGEVLVVGKILSIPINKIRPFKKQPRTYFQHEALLRLGKSILEKGQKEAIQVRELGEAEDPNFEYELVNGERRWRACKLVGIKNILARVVETNSTEQQHLDSLMLNFMSEGHTAVEISQALTYQYKAGVSVEEIATAVGRSDCWVYQYMSLQKLLPELIALMDPDVPKNKRLKVSLAIKLAELPQDLQLEAYNLAIHERGVARARAVKDFAESRAGLLVKTRKRKPSDDVMVFLNFIRKLDSDVSYLLKMRLEVFESLVIRREESEIDDIIATLSAGRDRLGLLVKKVRDAQKKEAVA